MLRSQVERGGRGVGFGERELKEESCGLWAWEAGWRLVVLFMVVLDGEPKMVVRALIGEAVGACGEGGMLGRGLEMGWKGGDG